jgi:hypothetical protein
MEEKHCCELRRLEKSTVAVDVEIKLPEHFKQKLAKESKTNFDIELNLNNAQDGNCIFAIGSNFFNSAENGLFRVETGKNLPNIFYQESLSIKLPDLLKNMASKEVMIMLCRNIINQNELRIKRNSDWNKKITFEQVMGKKANESDPNFAEGKVEISLTPRLVKSSSGGIECCGGASSGLPDGTAAR